MCFGIFAVLYITYDSHVMRKTEFDDFALGYNYAKRFCFVYLFFALT